MHNEQISPYALHGVGHCCTEGCEGLAFDGPFCLRCRQGIDELERLHSLERPVRRRMTLLTWLNLIFVLAGLAYFLGPWVIAFWEWKR